MTDWNKEIQVTLTYDELLHLTAYLRLVMEQQKEMVNQFGGMTLEAWKKHEDLVEKLEKLLKEPLGA